MTPRILLFLMASTAVTAAAQAPDAAQTARREDVTAIYSLLLRSNDPVYLIGETMVVPGGPAVRDMQSCISLPTERAASWAEIVAAFNSRQPGTGTIPSDLKLPRPYVSLSDTDIQEFRNDRMQAYRDARAANSEPFREVLLGGSSDPKFRGARDLFQFSEVYFDQSRTVAVTFVQIYSSPRAGSWRWAAFEKASSGRWEQRPQWARCMAVA